jgi:RNA polymerase sigma-70 factor (family 1)
VHFANLSFFLTFTPQLIAALTGRSQYTEKRLLHLVAKGDAQAFREFFDLYKNRIFVFVEQLIHSKADAEEIVQDTFLKVWQTAPTLSEIDNPGQYIYTIARNKTLNYIRKIASDKNLLEQVWACQANLDTTLEEKLRTKEVKEIIDRALGQLSEQKQTVFHLSREQGLTHAEIASQMDLSQSRVKNILVEVLKHIKNNLHPYSDLIAILFWMEYSRYFF